MSERKSRRRKSRSLERQHHHNHANHGSTNGQRHRRNNNEPTTASTAAAASASASASSSSSSDDETGSNTDTIRENRNMAGGHERLMPAVAVVDVHHRLHSTILITDVLDSTPTTATDHAKTPTTTGTTTIALDVNQNHLLSHDRQTTSDGYERMQNRAPGSFRRNNDTKLATLNAIGSVPIRRKQFFEPISDSSTSFDEMSGDDGVGGSTSSIAASIYNRDDTTYERIEFGNEVRMHRRNDRL